MVPKYTPLASRESVATFQCGCDGGAQPKFIDPFGYHMVGCKIGANAIRLHDEVVLLLAKLFRSLRLDAIVEPIRLFAEASGDRNSQRPDILLRNPRGFGRQVIMDVAVTGLDGQSRPTEDHPNRHLQARYDQKMAKYGYIAEQNRFQLIPAIFSHTGQIHDAFKDFLREQIRYKIVAFEGYAKSSNISSTMKWWSKCISMVIAKTASRNVAFKAARLGDLIFDRQSEILRTEDAQVNSPSHEEDLDDVGCNADLYASRQDAFQGSSRCSDERSQQQSDPHCFQSLSLD